MMRLCLLASLILFGQSESKTPANAPQSGKLLEKSAYFAYADREYIFTIEVVEANVPLLNFVSMSDNDRKLFAKDIRIELGNRRGVGKLFIIDTADPKQPMKTPSITIHARSSFGLQIEGDFSKTNEFYGVSIQAGAEVFKLAPLASFDFENLALKINRINLGSPDFTDDWRVLKLEYIGSKSAARRMN